MKRCLFPWFLAAAVCEVCAAVDDGVTPWRQDQPPNQPYSPQEAISKPLSNAEAWGVYEAFIADDRIVFRDEPPGLAVIWKKLAVRRTSLPKLWMDAYLAALAIACGAQLVTTDEAFTQFPGLDVLVVKTS